MQEACLRTDEDVERPRSAREQDAEAVVGDRDEIRLSVAVDVADPHVFGAEVELVFDGPQKGQATGCGRPVEQRRRPTAPVADRSQIEAAVVVEIADDDVEGSPSPVSATGAANASPASLVIRMIERPFERVTTRSAWPSPSRSASASPNTPGAASGSTVNVGAAAPTGVVSIRIDTVPSLMFDTARSGLWSPSRSAVAITNGADPTMKSVEGAKSTTPPTVVLSSTETVFDTTLGGFPVFATARSGRPSPLKSAMATPPGLVPTMKSTRGANVAVGVPTVVVLMNTETVFVL